MTGETTWQCPPGHMASDAAASETREFFNEDAFPDAPFDEEDSSDEDAAKDWILSTSLEASEGGSAIRHISLEHKLETVTIVTGIDKRIHLGRLCDANPDIFGVRSQGIAEFTLVFSA